MRRIVNFSFTHLSCLPKKGDQRTAPRGKPMKICKGKFSNVFPFGNPFRFCANVYNSLVGATIGRPLFVKLRCGRPMAAPTSTFERFATLICRVRRPRRTVAPTLTSLQITKFYLKFHKIGQIIGWIYPRKYPRIYPKSEKLGKPFDLPSFCYIFL